MNSIRIMLIDDEANVLSSLQRMLRQHPPVPGRPCVVETFSSPLAAIAAAQERVFDVIVCDYRMPELDGIETLRRLREMHPQTARILLSGSREFDTVVDAINVAQVGRIVIKPWGDDELLAAIADAVETRRLRLENAELADQLRLQLGLLTQQDAELRRLEAMCPGITRVEWTEDGSVRMSDADVLNTSFGKFR
ncbi:MAG TPA: response regulator [Albitalea sp.]|jgi:DNA-binding NtrC family response regulator|nr:response regulator [Albitalea sp.]